jgi:hypothetical protein
MREEFVTLNRIHDDLQSLSREVASLVSRVRRVRPSLRSRTKRTIGELEAASGSLFERLAILNAELLPYGKVTGDHNRDMQMGQVFGMYVAVSNSVRSLLSDANASIASLRNERQFRGSLYFSVGAILFALVSALADVINLV